MSARKLNLTREMSSIIETVSSKQLTSVKPPVLKAETRWKKLRRLDMTVKRLTILPPEAVAKALQELKEETAKHSSGVMYKLDVTHEMRCDEYGIWHREEKSVWRKETGEEVLARGRAKVPADPSVRAERANALLEAVDIMRKVEKVENSTC